MRAPAKPATNVRRVVCGTFLMVPFHHASRTPAVMHMSSATATMVGNVKANLGRGVTAIRRTAKGSNSVQSGPLSGKAVFATRRRAHVIWFREPGADLAYPKYPRGMGGAGADHPGFGVAAHRSGAAATCLGSGRRASNSWQEWR